MKSLLKSALVLIAGSLITAQSGFAIGDQHGVFRSQSTQGPQWMGTAVIEEEEFRITVHPNYLDVELDWVFRVGGKEPEKFSDALEIVGNLNLAKNSVVVGLLTWWKGDILKGKLKTTQMARADYEEVVQRDADAPPPPRDPVLIEYGWGIDNYDISIFPAKFGETRKVRIHYLISANSIGGTVKVSYPHAFTGNAKVSVKAGPDVASYKVEAGPNIVPFINKTLQPLSGTDFSFGGRGLGASAGPRINYIVPVLSDVSDGSRFYVGDISKPNLQAQAGHIVVMDAQKIIAKSNLKEDFVILWRWSHTRLLEAYAGQIVSQSKLLKTFLAKLEGANKRAALIIDKEGGERVTFALAKLDEHKKMLAYLDALASLAIKEPPQVTERPNYKLEADVKKAESDFESAIAAAINLFEKNDNIRHLLILTAGPQIIYNNSGSIALKIDSTLHIGALTDYAEKLDLDLVVGPEDRMIYWPGINPSPILTKQTLNLGIEAVVSNGFQLCTLAVTASSDPNAGYYGSRSEIEKHVFSKPGLIPKVNWTITQENKVIASFEEPAVMVPIENPLALAQLMGASRALIPMAPGLPRSLAAAAGFIDSTYSLVALEEDKLSASDAGQYASAGVPALIAADIKANPNDLINLPAGEWIKENPPQKIWNIAGTYSFGGFRGGFPEIAMDFMKDKVVQAGNPPKAGQAGAFMPMPIAGELSATSGMKYSDYSKEISAGILAPNKTTSFRSFAHIKGRMLILELATVIPNLTGEAQLHVYDLKGALIYSRSLSKSSRQAFYEIPISQLSRQGGLYIVQIKSMTGIFRQKLLLPAS